MSNIMNNILRPAALRAASTSAVLMAALAAPPALAQEVINVNANLGVAGGFANVVLSRDDTDGINDYVINIGSDRRVFGAFDFSQASGDVLINNAGDGEGLALNASGWRFRGDAMRFGSGDVHIENSGFMATNQAHGYTNSVGNPAVTFVETVVDFGGGTNSIRNTGIMVFGEGAATVNNQASAAGMAQTPASSTRFENLDTFENSGLLVFGGMGGQLSSINSAPARYIRAGEVSRVGNSEIVSGGTDGTTHSSRINLGGVNDTLHMPGTHFIGGAGSMMLLDVVMNRGVPQRGCDAPRDAAPYYTLPGADCLDLTGGSTEGSTEVVVRDPRAREPGAWNPEGIVIVDVRGGASDAAHFTLSEASDRYDPSLGGLDKDLFFYRLEFDEENQQHKMVSHVHGRALGMPLLLHAAQEVGRTAAGGWFERQADLRQVEGEAVGGAWAHFNSSWADRDALQSHGDSGVVFDNSYSQDSQAFTMGIDALRGGEGDRSWVLGGSIGYVHASMDFDTSPAKATFDGATLGAYGSYSAGNAYVDAALNMGWMQMDGRLPMYDMRRIQGAFAPVLDLTHTDLNANFRTMGVQLEAGWMLPLEGGLQVEPLAGVSWARASHENMAIRAPDLEITGYTITGARQDSLRASLGLRLGLEQRLQALRLHYSLTGRVAQEFAGEAASGIRNAGPSLVVEDTLDGTFTELRASVGISDVSGRLSVLLGGMVEFANDYDRYGMTAGFRYQW